MTAILAAPVAVEYQTKWRASAPLRHGQCVLDQARLHMRLQAPAHHLTAEQVNDRSQVQPALAGLDVGDVTTTVLRWQVRLTRTFELRHVYGRCWSNVRFPNDWFGSLQMTATGR